jgi:hypothetical protein
VNNFTPMLGDTFYILDNTSSDPTKPTIGLFSDGATVTDNFGNVYAINYFASDPNNTTGILGRDISLTFVGVPEPSSWILLGSGAGVLLFLRCLRRRRQTPSA